MVDKIAQLQAILWLLRQRSQDMAHYERRAPTLCKMTFANTGVNITTYGKRHLGAALGSTSFVESYAQCKVSQWVDTVKKLSCIALTQPHAAYSAFTHGLASK